MSLLPLAIFLAALQADSALATGAESHQRVRTGLRSEFGAHFGAPLRVSAHGSWLLPVNERGIEIEGDYEARRRGVELHGEVGLGGARIQLGWGERHTPYYAGWSTGVAIIRTFESVDDPLGFEEDLTLVALSGRYVALGLSLRLDLTHSQERGSDDWGVGWSVGLVLW